MFGRVTLGTRLPAAEGQARTHQPSKSPGVVLFFRRIRVLRALWAAIANGVSWGFFNFLLSCNDLTVRSVLSHLRSQHHLPQIVLLVLLVARCPCPTARILSAGLYRRKHGFYAKLLLPIGPHSETSRVQVGKAEPWTATAGTESGKGKHRNKRYPGLGVDPGKCLQMSVPAIDAYQSYVHVSVRLDEGYPFILTISLHTQRYAPPARQFSSCLRQ